MSVSSIARQARNRAFRSILARRGLEVITEPSKNDVIIAAYPKSGNTWMQCIIAGLKYGVDASTAPDTLIQDLVPDVHRVRIGRRYSKSICLKSHNLPSSSARKVIHLVRDGRDVLVSYYHYKRALGFKGGMEELIYEKHPIYADWGQHSRRWLENPFQADILLIRYEELKIFPEAEFKRICAFLEMDVSQQRLEEVRRWTGLRAMQKRETALGWDNPVWPKDKNFIRRGEVGSYLDELPQDVLRQFESRHAETLSVLGYSIS